MCYGRQVVRACVRSFVRSFVRSRHGRIGASTAARMFFPRVCFPTHDAPSNFQDEPNVRVHDNDREYCRKGNAGGNTVIVVVWLFVKRV